MPVKTHQPLSADFIRSILDYDPLTGVFRWRFRPEQPKKWNTRYAGKVAGSTHRAGYVKIQIGKRMHYSAHVLAWLHVYGEWLPNQIDHRHGDRSDNRIAMLRKADGSENSVNKPMQRNNTSGYVGVHFDEQRGKWRASISRMRKRVFDQFFDTAEAAHNARTNAMAEIYGEFVPSAHARKKYIHFRDI